MRKRLGILAVLAGAIALTGVSNRVYSDGIDLHSVNLGTLPYRSLVVNSEDEIVGFNIFGAGRLDFPEEKIFVYKNGMKTDEAMNDKIREQYHMYLEYPEIIGINWDETHWKSYVFSPQKLKDFRVTLEKSVLQSLSDGTFEDNGTAKVIEDTVYIYHTIREK